MYQRAHARFIENMIYKPLLIQENIEPKKAKVKLNWGLQEPLEIDDITKIYNVLKDDIFNDLYNPQDIIDMFAEAGVKFTPPKKQAKEISDQLKAIHRLQSQHEKKIPISSLSQSEQIRELILKNKK